MPVAFPLFLAFVAFSYLQIGIRVPFLGAIRTEFILGGILAILAFIAVGQRRLALEWTAVGRWGTALVALLAVMTVFSIDWTVSSDVFVDRVFKFSLIGLFVAAFVTTPLRLKLFIAVFLAACAKMGQEGLLGTITGSMMWENQGIPRLHGSTPSYFHPNSFSGMALGALPFIVFIFPLVSRKWRIALIIVALMMLNIVLRTGSRTGYVAFAIGVLWLTSYSKHRFRAFLTLGILVAVAVPFVPRDYVERAQSIFAPVEVGEDTSSGKRMEILVDAWQVFLHRPFGVGVGAFPVIRKQWFGRVQDTHNLYLEVATNAGVQGLVIFAGFLTALISSLRRTRRNAETDLAALGWAAGSAHRIDALPEQVREHVGDLLWIRALSSAFLGFLVIRLALGLFGMDLYERYWWFAGGGAVALWNLMRAASIRTRLLVGGTTAPVPGRHAARPPGPRVDPVRGPRRAPAGRTQLPDWR
jgi:O-antigen ligase